MSLKFTVLLLVLDIIACISAKNDYGKIVLANVFFRHGDRTPLETYPNDPYNAVDTYWPEGLGQLTEVAAVRQRLVSPQQIHRVLSVFCRWVGSRNTPLVNISAADTPGVVCLPQVGREQQYALGQYLRCRYTGLCLFAAGGWVGSSNTPLVNISAEDTPGVVCFLQGVVCLLQVGREQQYALGQHLRRIYSDLLPEVYSYKDLYVKSEDDDRCVMSAECSLFALYPPLYNTSSGKNIVFQPIPIHTVPASQDPVSAEHLMWDNHPFKSYARDPYRTNSIIKVLEISVSLVGWMWPTGSEFANPRLKCSCDLFLSLSRTLTGQVSTEMQSHVRYIEQILCMIGQMGGVISQDLHNLTLPNWTAKYYPEPLQVINQFYWYLGVAGTKELQKVAIGSFLNEMVGNMVAKKNGTLSPDRKMFLYPGHDYTISDTFLALDIYDGVRVPCASFASIELRLKDNSHYVLITYSNSTTQDPYIMKLPNCDELCPFDTFLKIVQPMLVTDFNSECAKAPGSQEDWAIPIQNLPEEWKICFASSTNTTPN
uniref:acid phosphatase n=1 Tax=Timema poppense TaxID=170557 RepID=A0A7R9HDM7_TIMPO|nr:unnamed protein product [Timema poppensis]